MFSRQAAGETPTLPEAARPPTEYRSKGFLGLKAQKPLAQGNALGNVICDKSP